MTSLHPFILRRTNRNRTPAVTVPRTLGTHAAVHRFGSFWLRTWLAVPMLLVALMSASAFAQNTRCLQITCPTNRTVECLNPTGTPVLFSATAQATCGNLTSLICTPPSGSSFRTGVTAVTCVATDDQRNTVECAFQITVQDAKGPHLQVPTGVNVPCSGAAGANVDFSVTATDDCDPNPGVECRPPAGSLFPPGTTTVECAASDANGNLAHASFPVLVFDCPPDCLQMICPTNVTLNLGSGRGVVTNRFGGSPAVAASYNVEAVNTCTESNVLAVCAPPSGSFFGLGTTVVNCFASDGISRAVCSFEVRVQDVTPPTITVPRTLFVFCKEKLADGSQGAAVAYTVKATDNAGTPALTCTPPSGSFFPVGTNWIQCVAADAAGNKATNQFVIQVNESRSCSLLSTLEEFPDNWGFELGLTAWESEGDAFADQPVQGDQMPVRRVKTLADEMQNDLGGDYWHDVAYPIGHKGEHWIGTAEDINALPGGLFEDANTEVRTGTLRSKSFIIEKHYISFLIGGQEDAQKLRVELLLQTDASGPGTVSYDGLFYKVSGLPATGHNREVMRWQQWGVGLHIGERAIIRIIDNSTTGHLNVDDFRFESAHFLGQTVKIGGVTHPAWIEFEGHSYRWDSPVWGFADLHTHPMSYLGFGHYVMHGQPDGNIQTALENCRCRHGGWGVDNQCGDYLREIVMGVMEDGTPSSHGNGYVVDNSYAQFNGWPVFWTISHQQMWHSWVKRAHAGGLRIMVALCVNNPMLAVGTKGDHPNDDKSVGDAQIDALKAFVDRHSSFMEIAYDPFQLRDIVRRNKLAVIIGSELDDIGNFARNGSVNQWAPTAADKEKVRAEIDRLYNKGLRYIFPVHLVNNHFGGTAIAGDMLNVANKFMNHEAFEVDAATSDEHITLYLEDLDYTEEAVGIAAAAPLAPLILPALLPVAEAILASEGAPPGTGAAIGAGVLPLALLGTALLPVVGVEIGEAGIPSEVLPLFGNFPNYYQKGEAAGWDHGHKNNKGLTPLGKYAVLEMMKRGLILDIDHMSQKALGKVFAMATNNPVGYPLNSGHNSPRALGFERGENSRTLEQLQVVSRLGGLFGVGWENSESHSFKGYGPSHEYTQSDIPNDCAGTSKTYAQYYLYGLEAMRGRGVAFGTDINGLIPAPGPRFGPMSGFALGNDKYHQRKEQVWAQHNGVRYTEEHGHPIATPMFIGRAVDPAVDTTYPRTELGYAYNREQGDAFAALSIYFWARAAVENGPQDPGQGEAAIKPVLEKVVNAGAYANRGRVLLFALGMLRGIHDWPVTSDFLDGNVEAMQKLGKALYEVKVAETTLLPQYVNTSALKPRFDRLITVWNHYHRIFGDNVPLKRSQTGFKQWDINFEGVAHYGLVPDFLQDLTNVGLAPEDLSVLYKSAEHFAQMWTRTLDAADAIVHPQVYAPSSLLSAGALKIQWFGEDGDQLEESDNLNDPSRWRPSPAQVRVDENQAEAIVQLEPRSAARFFRVRKP